MERARAAKEAAMYGRYWSVVVVMGSVAVSMSSPRRR
jgi:hypothetical protein